MDRPVARPSDKPLVDYGIVRGDSDQASPLNRVYSCYGHPEDGPAALVLRSPGEFDDMHVEIERVDTLEENPGTGSTHFTGYLVDGRAISGYFPPGPATTELVGKATITF